MESTSTSLYPGYTHVEQFGADEDYESEEEVSYVTFDLGNIEPTLVPSSSTYRLIATVQGLDTPTPYLQLSGTILKGRHDSLLGTELLFTDEKGTYPQDRNKRSVVHVANTEQRVMFKEVRLQSKEQDTTCSQRIDPNQAPGPSTATQPNKRNGIESVLGPARPKRKTKKPPKQVKGKGKAKATEDIDGDGRGAEDPQRDVAMDTSAG
ncbi:hypothetical protein M378DRAFT_126839 [Amanita muscaria Koide BX008]|uniref:Transcription factor TFIIIC triple barrel domain-containing protein n=1 Tax=Amanita muscaria (strain Koide BX008) TaxID=946122 RepID=A0A0C2X4K5_AMAMK|nr:hypothetical protein M378DRAFT_126839 [Amanita muscaria Koide BX008]